MAFYDQVWYCNAGDQSTTGYYAVAKRPQNIAVVAGIIRRQFTAPAVGSERCFVCIVAGTTANVTDATWLLTRGAKTTDGTATWQECTGASAVNGDLTNTATWTTAKAIGTPTLGAIIKRNNGASYQICTTAGTMAASEPAFSDTAGVTTADGTSVWTSLGVVGNFTSGQAPFARLASAVLSTWFAAGNTVYVGDNHAESQATAITISPTVTAATVGRILCHNHSGSYPPAAGDLTTGATVSMTVAGSLTFNPANGAMYVYGIAFRAGVGISSGASFIVTTPSNAFYFFDCCSFLILNTSGSVSTVQLTTTAAGVIVWNNCTVSFGAVGQYIDVGTCSFTWQNTGQVLAGGSVVPTALLAASANGRLSNVMLEALDLSQITTTLTGLAGVVAMSNWFIKDCKLNASTAILTPQSFGQTIQLLRCDSGATNYKSSRYQYEGTETTETSITRVGGATDGTTADSRKAVTTANSQWLRPFTLMPLAVWNEVTGADVTVTVNGTINSGSLPNNDEIWMDIEYLGTSGTPLGVIKTTTKASVLAANAAVASDSSVWNGAITGPAATWDPATVTAVTLSGGNLITSNTGTTSADQGAHVASTSGKTSGKYYFEGTLTAAAFAGNFGIGVGTPTSTYTGMGQTGGATGAIMFYASGNIYANSSNTGVSLGAIGAAGNVIGVAIDLDNRTAFFKKVSGTPGNWNGSGTANPATNTGGIPIPAGTMVPFLTYGGTSGTSGIIHTANFGASTFTGAVPSGFAPGWMDVWSPFKLTTTLSSPQPQMKGYIYATVKVAKLSTTYYIDPQVILS